MHMLPSAHAVRPVVAVVLMAGVAARPAQPDLTDKKAEAEAWAAQKATAEAAVGFWIDFLDLRHGSANDKKFDAAGDPDGKMRARLVCAVRAISWVESRHGTGAGNHPDRDPVQCGNPADTWWKELTGQVPQGNQDRFVGGPGAKNYYAAQLPGGAEAAAGFPAAGKLGTLADAKKGHTDPKFTQTMSYYWGVIYFIHRMNTDPALPADRRTYKCGDCSLDRRKRGAVGYNGKGDAAYGEKIAKTLTMIGCD